MKHGHFLGTLFLRDGLSSEPNRITAATVEPLLSSRLGNAMSLGHRTCDDDHLMSISGLPSRIGHGRNCPSTAAPRPGPGWVFERLLIGAPTARIDKKITVSTRSQRERRTITMQIEIRTAMLFTDMVDIHPSLRLSCHRPVGPQAAVDRRNRHASRCAPAILTVAPPPDRPCPLFVGVDPKPSWSAVSARRVLLARRCRQERRHTQTRELHRQSMAPS